MPNSLSENAPLTHIGFILDGNRRWAKENGLTKYQGHLQGYKNLHTIAEACWERGIQYFSCYVFSTENWKREVKEVDYLIGLLLKVVLKDAKKLNEKNIRIKVLGSRKNLDAKVVTAIDRAEELTRNNTGGMFLPCFNYGGQEEIAHAVQAMITEGVPADDVTPELIKSHLYTADIPAPDLIVRTSGEQRMSNFLLWDSAYAELAFMQKHWPDFSEQDLDDVLADYTSRNRRFGK